MAPMSNTVSRLYTTPLKWQRSKYRDGALNASVGDVLFWSDLPHIDRKLPKISFRVERSTVNAGGWELSIWTNCLTERAAVWSLDTQRAAKEASQLLVEAVCAWWADYNVAVPTKDTPLVLRSFIRECQSPCEIWAGFPTVRGAQDVERLRRIGVVRHLDTV